MKAAEIAEILMQSKNLEASIIIIQEYAKAQIEKDRERVKLNDGISDSLETIMKLTPIILD